MSISSHMTHGVKYVLYSTYIYATYICAESTFCVRLKQGKLAH